MRKPSKILSFIAYLFSILFSLSAAVAVPILWRGWYYRQAVVLELPERTGFDLETIRQAFNNVMDFLVKGEEFGTGALKWSESGAAHFADCRVLFRLDFVILTVSAVVLLALFILGKNGFLPHRFLRRTPAFWALLTTLLLLLLFGTWAYVDFDGLFTAFHHLFFPGKENWVFDYRTDEIILILPEEFWLRTAALVSELTLVIQAALVLLPALRHCRDPKTAYEAARRL